MLDRVGYGPRIAWEAAAGMRAVVVLASALSLAGCVTAGLEGLPANMMDGSAGSATEQRNAIEAVAVLDAPPANMSPLGEVTARRCHRNATDPEPSPAALKMDLQVAAYATGADAIVIGQTRRLNGLMANCWYVLEGSAKTFKR